jgi:hypothetical protein
MSGASKEILSEKLPRAEEWFTLHIHSFQPPAKPEETGDYDLYFRVSCNTAKRVTCNQMVVKLGVGAPIWDYASGEEAEREELARTFGYKIGDSFNPTAINNTV